MGLAGGPHCVAMCGAACAGIGQAAGPARGRALLSFQAGRVIGYAGLGALAAASMQGLGWLTVQSVALRPLWTFLHIAAIALGLLLLWRARQPQWLETWGRFFWARAQGLGLHTGVAPGAVGMLWALLPCGLLYSAVMVSALAGSVAGGALLMACLRWAAASACWLGPGCGCAGRRAGPCPPIARSRPPLHPCRHARAIGAVRRQALLLCFIRQEFR